VILAYHHHRRRHIISSDALNGGCELLPAVTYILRCLRNKRLRLVIDFRSSGNNQRTRALNRGHLSRPGRRPVAAVVRIRFTAAGRKKINRFACFTSASNLNYPAAAAAAAYKTSLRAFDDPPS